MKKPTTLQEIREAAKNTLSQFAVISVNIEATWGTVCVFKDGTIKLWEDCPEFH